MGIEGSREPLAMQKVECSSPFSRSLRIPRARQSEAIADAELQRALEDPDPLRAIAGLVARWSAAFVLDPDGVTRTEALGSERMARRLRDALPGGQHPLRPAVWEFLRPMLSPRLVELHRNAFVIDDGPQSTVDLQAHGGESSLQDLDLDEHEPTARETRQAGLRFPSVGRATALPLVWASRK